MAPGILHSTDLSSEIFLLGWAPEHGKTSHRVTSGWPSSFHSKIAWDATTFSCREDYTLELSAIEKSELNAALAHFKGLGLDAQDINRETFPLPVLGAKLRAIALDIHDGKGFHNIHGLDPAGISPEDNILLFLGISSYIADKRGKQNDNGDVLTHIINASNAIDSEIERPIRYSTLASTFHCDTFADILAMQVRACAAQGGKHIIASAASIYNELADSEVETLEVLAQPDWAFDSRSELLPTNTRPLLSYHDQRLILNFSREPLVGLKGVKRNPKLPVLNTKQKRALDLVESIASRNKVVLDLIPGDVLFINNLGILHSREAFENNRECTRYLVRMWLKNSELAWNLPSHLQTGNSRIYEENEFEERWNPVPEPKLRYTVADRCTS
ncbi:hypothetical protein TWF730_002506 [Orbilia blumenaviensis]|uniref:TauD/TfdA-like domain-containing protein n=1 Tax=Orbilia blumenaviensis TaxID=1796055 RepID=A0AAV9UAU9_9PEZI